MNMLKKNKNVDTEDVLKSATYEYDMKKVLEHLESSKLVKAKSVYNSNKGRNTTRMELSRSFQDFFNMEL